MKYCSNCGSKVIPNAKFCIGCGYELKKAIVKPDDNTSMPKEEKKMQKNFDSLNKRNKNYVEWGIELIKNKNDKTEETEAENEAKKVKKNFDALNKKNKNKNNKNDFDLIRPNTSDNQKKKND